MYNTEASDEHPVDKALRIERLAREIVDAATDDLNNTVPTLTPDELLCGLERRCRALWEQQYAAGNTLTYAFAGIDLGKPATRCDVPAYVQVRWSPDAAYAYFFMEQNGILHGEFPTRDLALYALTVRLGGVTVVAK